MSRDPLSNPEPLIRRVYAYVAYRLGDGPDAEDVTSATFERALRYRSTFDATKGEPVAWLVGIARRCIAEAVAARPNAVAIPDDAAADVESFEDRAVGRADMAAALAELATRDRELIALRFGADMTAREMGELLGERTNTVEVALHRALGRLRTALAGRRAA